MNLTSTRAKMIEEQLIRRGIEDPTLLEAMRSVPRDVFVPENHRDLAYEDSPLPIGKGQTISQPYIVALMIESLELTGGERALEIGTGSGYAAAVLSRIAAEVYTVERHFSLAETARERFRQLGYTNIFVHVGDGSLGWSEHAPYDVVVVTAGAPEIPRPLMAQLAVGGRLVIPVGPSPDRQKLLRLRHERPKDFRQDSLEVVRFVPLVGAEAW